MPLDEGNSSSPPLKVLLSLDPGTTTGWAVKWENLPNQWIWESGQITQEEVWPLLQKWYPTHLIVESFSLRRLPKVVLTPVEVIGAVKEWHRQNPQVSLFWQTPAMRVYFTDKQLKDRGLWKTNSPHAMDAIRHLLYFTKDFVK